MFKTAHQNETGKPKRTIRQFASDVRGTFAPTFALATMAIMLSAGAAIDYSQLARAKSIMGTSLDAAVLAAGNEYLEKAPNDAALRKVFEDYFYANLAGNAELMENATIDRFEFNRQTGQVNAEVGTPVQMAFMGLIGKPELPIKARTEASFSTTPVEVSMVLDVTGSMGSDGKMDALKLAAKDAIDILLPDGASSSSVRVGLVPYAAGVNGGNYARQATGTNRTCATERRNFVATDRYYTADPLGADPHANCPSARVRPLTSDAKRLKQDINAFHPSGFTAGHLGIGWSYYMLSQNWQRLWPNGSKPDNYGTSTKKIAILMTDGEFNTFYRGVHDNQQGGHANLSNAEAIALCDDMKAPKAGGDGIRIYSIAFNAPASAKATLQDCASGTDQFFDANSAEELRAAFREIAKSIKTLRLTR